jgi:uncharacterized protein involved in response to NO
MTSYLALLAGGLHGLRLARWKGWMIVAEPLMWMLHLGYVWLAVSGIIGLYYGILVAGPIYDAWLHALFLGFAFSMIFAHALIILPALVKITLPFHRGFYLPPILLHISLIMRIAGDLLLQQTLRQWGGLLNGVAILLFFFIVIVTVIQNKVKTNV